MEKSRICIYCGKTLTKNNYTRDHIPSRSLFPKGKIIKKPIIVDCCLDCNHSFSLDEEWFRLFLVNLSQDKSFAADQMFWTKIKNSIEKRPAIGHKIMNNMEVVDYYSQAGIYLGKKTKIKLTDDDWNRYHNVLNKYIKGLFYHHFGKRIEDCGFCVNHKLIDPTKIKPIPTLTFNLDNETIFLYAFAAIPSTFQSIFITTFYESINFISFVATPENFKKFDEKKN